MKRILILAAVLCVVALAADNTAAAPQAAVNLQSTVVGRQSPVTNDPEAITIPRMLSYQGKLTDTLGVPVPNGNYPMMFLLYTTPSGGSAFWTENQSVATKDGLFSVLLGAATPIGSMPDAGTVYLGMTVSGGPELIPRLRIASAAYAYKADTADYANAAPPSGAASGDLDGTYPGPTVDGLQNRPVSSAAPGLSQALVWDGDEWMPATVAPSGAAGGDLAGTYPNPTVDGLQGRSVSATAPGTNQVLKWTGSQWAPANDSVGSGGTGTVRKVVQATGVVCSPNPITDSGTVGFDQTYGDTRYVNEAQANSVTSAMITNATIAAADLGQMGASTGQVMKWTGSAWAPANDSAGAGDNAWVRVGSDSVLYTVHKLGISRGGAGNVLHGESTYTHVNLGVVCTTGTSGQNYYYSTVSGGYGNDAPRSYATVGGGSGNDATGEYATVGGGSSNDAASYATVAGGGSNTATNTYATVGGGQGNDATSYAATVSGGYNNDITTGNAATIGGGWFNHVGGNYSCVPGGYYDSVSAHYSFAVNNNSDALHNNSAAFNGEATTASNQTRVGVLSKASGSFTIDHPLDPSGKILNHYFIEGPEMRNIYEGAAVLDGSGRAEVRLPGYFDALNRNPHVQLTGVGTHEIHVAEDVVGNHFVIGGKPGVKVYWQVTGERKDVSAEATRRMMPVEQSKIGVLAGRMLDDDFLVGCMDQLVREGKAQGIDFRTAAGRQRHEKMKQNLRDAEQK